MEGKRVARILRRSWLWILATAIIGVAAGWAVAATTTPRYAATSAAFVSSDRTGTLTELTQGNAFTQSRVSTYAKLATEPLVTQPVIDDFDVGVTPREFAQRMTVTIPVDTTLIEITVEDASPGRASSLANALMTSLSTTVAEIESPTTQTSADGTVISEPAPPVKITPVRPAEIPETPVSPKLSLNLAIGLLAGLALGALLAILRDMLDTRIRSVEEVEAITPIPVVGVIPPRPRGRSVTDLTRDEAGDSFNESFRILRTNLQFLDLDAPSTFLITSPSGGDGKSTVTSNLAVSIAANGSRVLVIDADLRRPKIHERFGIEGSAGLTDILIGRASLTDVVQHWGTNLHLLAAGQIPPNPSEMLGSRQMQEFMKHMQTRYDVVLYDCAPVLPVPDAAILSRHVGGVILVTSADSSRREQVLWALRALQKVNARVAGIVMNRLALRGSMAYVAESYHSHENESNGTGSDPTDAVPTDSAPSDDSQVSRTVAKPSGRAFLDNETLPRRAAHAPRHGASRR